MGQRFEGRVAVVTGASRGIGLAVAKRIVQEGGRVCITGRRAEGLAAAIQELGGSEVAMSLAGPADSATHQDAVIAEVLDRFGQLDILVNNTGVNPAFGPMMEVGTDVMQKIFDVNVVAALAWVSKAHDAWLGRFGGSVVNVVSVAGIRPARGIGFYGTSKAALIQLTRQLAFELAPTIRVNAVAPAVVRTRFAGPLFEGREEAVANDYPLRRLGDPDDVAAAVAYLASDDASWVTGHVLTVDGGLTLNGGV